MKFFLTANIQSVQILPGGLLLLTILRWQFCFFWDWRQAAEPFSGNSWFDKLYFHICFIQSATWDLFIVCYCPSHLKKKNREQLFGILKIHITWCITLKNVIRPRRCISGAVSRHICCNISYVLRNSWSHLWKIPSYTLQIEWHSDRTCL